MVQIVQELPLRDMLKNARGNVRIIRSPKDLCNSPSNLTLLIKMQFAKGSKIPPNICESDQLFIRIFFYSIQFAVLCHLHNWVHILKVKNNAMGVLASE